MNTIRSVGYGWGVLIVAGAGSYYFAKKSVNADRAERAEAEERRRQQRERMRVQEALTRDAAMNNHASPASRTKPRTTDARNELSPSAQAVSTDPAPASKEASRSKYEAADPFRSRKGDRFS